MPATWFAIRPLAKATQAQPSSAEILIYGDIGTSWFDETVEAKSFCEQLAALDAQTITVRINSFGGSVPDALAICNALQRHPARIVTEIDGVAFSAASMIAAAGDTVNMSENAMLMIHAPWSYGGGNAVELRKKAELMDSFAQGMASVYARKLGSVQAALPLLTDGQDHYYTPQQALEAGLIDAITAATPVAASAAHMPGISRYRSLPATLAAGTVAAAAAPHQEPMMPNPNEPAAQPLAGTQQPQASAPQAALQPQAAAPAPQPQAQAPAPHAQAAPVPQAAAPDRAAILAAEQQRRGDIRAAFQPFATRADVSALQAQCEDDPAISAQDAGARLLALMGKTAQPVAGIHTVTDETDKRREAISAALLVRAGFGSKDQRENYAANPFRGASLMDIARGSVERSGKSSAGMDRRDIVATAFTQSTSDFPVLLTDAVHRTLLAAYATQALTWTRFCKRGQVSDFRPHHRFRVGSLGNLLPKTELGEYKNVSIPDGEKTSIAAATKGFIINISRETIINDDLGAITDQAAAMGRAAARTVEADVYAMLLLNSGMGPTMNDGKPLFHASHKNIAPAAAPSSQAFNELRVLMAKQMDISGNDYLDMRPAVWLGPIGLEAQARLINEAQYEPNPTQNALTPNVSLGLFRDIVGTPRLEGTRYYAFANPSESAALEVAFLDGVDTPYLERQDAFDTDGVRWKVRLDYGVAGHDWRGAVTSAGAGA